MTWNPANAKNRLTKVVNLALTEGPQIITHRKDAVVVISVSRYEELTGNQPRFKQFLTQGESFEGLSLTRDDTPMRELGL